MRLRRPNKTLCLTFKPEIHGEDIEALDYFSLLSRFRELDIVIFLVNTMPDVTNHSEALKEEVKQVYTRHTIPIYVFKHETLKSMLGYIHFTLATVYIMC